MKWKWAICVFFVLVAVAMRLPAQQSEADGKLLTDIRAKAEKGNAECQYVLGLTFTFGYLGVAQDYAEAVKWYRKAADQNYAWAESNLGAFYEQGQGVVKDDVEAVKWYRKAANQGDIVAQSNLGAMYADGHGVPQDYVEAVKWYRKAAEQGFAGGQYNLGRCYGLGQGVTKDYMEAVKWFRKAAEQGLADAQNSLGAMYEEGNGVTQDYVEAYKWYNLAASQGDSNGIGNRDKIVSRMTPEQIAEGQQSAREFTPRTELSSKKSTSSENPFASGTGFFITDDGYLISNYHVVKDATKVCLVTGRGLIAVTVVKVDAANDLALLKVANEETFKPLPIASSRTVHLGNTVITFGFPDTGLQGFAPKFARGEIASLAGARDDSHYFQISVPVQPGNSGGALVDERGNVIGIVSAKLDAAVALAASGALPENVNYAVKSSLLLSFLESVPDVSAKLKEPIIIDRKFGDVVKSAQDAAVLVLVY